MLLLLLACTAIDPAPKGDTSTPSTTPTTPTTPTEVVRQHAVAVYTAARATCAHLDDGTALCWGDREVADATPTEPLATLSVEGVACGLRASDDTLVCWGDASFDGGILDTVPDGAYATVDVGEQFACAIAADGDTVCWGAMDWLDGPLSAVPPPDGPLGSVRAGSFTACGTLAALGELACWGADEEFPPNQPDLNLLDDAPQGAEPLLYDVYRYAGCWVDQAGALACWGALERSEVDSGIAGREPDIDGTIVQLDLDFAQACVLTDDGTPTCWGDNAVSPPAGPFVHLSAGHDHACAVDPDGAVHCWGEDDLGETVVPPSLAP